MLAGIVVVVLGLFVAGGLLQEVEADKKIVKPAIKKSATTTAVLQGGPCDISSNFDDDFDDTPASSVVENFDRCKTK
ncbi:MAG: hypothetical protein WDN00_02540 [Limisphaerales bacterium]